MKLFSGSVSTAALVTFVLVAALVPATQAAEQGTAPVQSTGATTLVYLLRHAEAGEPPYSKSSPDPSLNAAGRTRAARLVEVLGDAGVTRMFSTAYNRTTETVGPLSQRLDLEVESYDPRALEDFARRLRSMSGRIVVAGHSNTTPALVGFLGGDPGESIDEKVEFDRLYIVALRQGEPTTTILLRYGLAQPGEQALP